MLKQVNKSKNITYTKPAAFRRLCVETKLKAQRPKPKKGQPPSGGCVLKLQQLKEQQKETQPAAFRRLCVET